MINDSTHGREVYHVCQDETVVLHRSAGAATHATVLYVLLASSLAHHAIYIVYLCIAHVVAAY